MEQKYVFKHFEVALIAFVADLEKKLQEILPSLPVFVLNTGDDFYFLDKKYSTDNKELYMKVPRVVINFEDLSPQTDQNTVKNIEYKYLLSDKRYISSARRISIMVPISVDFVSTSFVNALSNSEIMLSLTANDNVFTYEYLGNTYKSCYSLQSLSFEKALMEVGAVQKNTSVKSSIELQLNPYFVDYRSIGLAEDNEDFTTEALLIAHHDGNMDTAYVRKMNLNSDENNE